MASIIKKFGRYQIEKILGQGAMGVVYKANDPLLERPLAIKVMSSADEETTRRFFREARTTAVLRHPNVVSIYDIGEEDKQPYFAMEYLDGDDLGAFLKREDLFLPFSWKIRKIIEVCRGLQHAHDEEIVHRDIKPSNIRVTRAGVAKIVDFGVARLRSSEMTATGMLIGTPSFMSPEQIMGVRDLDGRSDLFSVGILLYELITGRKPFDADDFRAVMFQISNAPHPPLSDSFPGCSKELSSILDRALAKKLEDRFQSGAEMADALQVFLQRLPSLCANLRQEFESRKEKLNKLREEEGLEELANSLEPGLLKAPASTQKLDADLVQDFGLDSEALDQASDYGILLQSHAELSRRLARVGELREKFKEFQEGLQNCKRLFEDSQWQRCLADLDPLLKDFPNHPAAVQLRQHCLDRLEAEKREAKRQSALKEALQNAKKALQEGQPVSALNEVQRALELDPANSLAVDLKSRAEKARQNEEKLQGYLEKAVAAHQEGRFQDCLKAARSGLKLQPDYRQLQDLADKADRQLKKFAEADRLLEWAKDQAKVDLLEDCLQSVARGLELVPEHQGLLDLQRQTKQQVQQRSKVRDLLEQAGAQLQERSYSSVLKTVQQILDLDPANIEAAELAARAHRTLRQKDQARKKLAQARRFFASGNYPGCLKAVQDGLELDPDSSDLKALQEKALRRVEEDKQAAQRLKQVEQHLSRARQHAQSGDFKASLGSARKGLDLQPDHPQLLELQEQARSQLDRRDRLEALLKESGESLEQNDFAAALSRAEQILAEAPDHQQAKDLVARARQGLERQERLARISARTQECIGSKDFEAALQSVDEGLSIAPQDSRLLQLQEQAQQGIDALIQVQALLEEARSKLEDEEYSEVLRIAAELEEVSPGLPEAHQLEREARQGKDRRTRLEGLLARARPAASATDRTTRQELENCLQAAQEGLELVSDHEELKQLQEQAESHLLKLGSQAEEWRKKARGHLAGNDFAAALEIVAHMLKRDPESQSAIQLQQEARKGLDEEVRLREVEELEAKALASAESGELEPCLRIIDQALRLDPQRPSLIDLKERVSQELAKGRQVEEIASKRKLADWNLSKGRLAKAGQSIRFLQQHDPDSAQTRSLSKQLKELKAQRRRLQQYVAAGAAAVLLIGAVALWLFVTPPPPEVSFSLYQVQPGDTMEIISGRLGVSLEQMAASNGVTIDDAVYPGQVLRSMPPPEDSGTLLLSFAPWATIQSIANESEEEVLLNPGLTPLRLTLPAGEYAVEAINPANQQPLNFKVRVEAGEVKREFRHWPGFEMETGLSQLFSQGQ